MNIMISVQFERHWLKGQNTALTFCTLYNHCLDKCDISSKYRISLQQFSKNQPFSDFINALGMKFVIAVK